MIASQNNAELIVLNVLETYSLAGLPVEEFARRVYDAFRVEGEKALDNISTILNRKIKEEGLKNDLKLSLEQKEGSPADVILQTVDDEHIDLVVMGSAGKHSVERFLLGSVAQKVVSHANCPVLTVHCCTLNMN